MVALLRGSWLVMLLLVGAGHALAECGDDPGDAAAIAAARAQIDDECDCAGVPNHGTFVRCAARIAKERAKADPPLLPRQCKGAVKRCAARSTCGKPGTVTCCREKTLYGQTAIHCNIMKDAATCVARGGCAGTHTSCCDSCTATGCASPSGAFVGADVGF